MYAGTPSGVFSRGNLPFQTWQELSDSGLTDTMITALGSDPDSVNRVYAGTGSGIFKWVVMDSNWVPINTGLTNTNIRAITVDPGNGNILYTATAGGVFKSTDGGGNWVVKNSGLTNLDVRSLVIDPNVTTTLYAGTEREYSNFVGGVFKSLNGGDTWTAMNTGFSDWGVSPFIHQVHALTVVSSDTVFAGTRHGIFRSTDGSLNWAEENTGILRTFMKDTAVIDSILEIFDSKTPKDPSRGVYDIVKGGFGDEPDFDNDTLIYIILMDINQDPDVPQIYGYFDSENQYPIDTLHPNSNEHEILYLDYLDIDYNEEVSELAQNFQRMIHWNADSSEEAWVVGGMAELSKLLTGVANTSVTLPSLLDLTANDGRMTFLWMDYLFEKYGGLATIRDIVSDTLQGFSGIDAALSRQGYTETHIQIFEDWGVATALDYPSPSFNGGRYGYDSLTVNPGVLDVKFPTFGVTTKRWSLNFFTIDLDSLGGDTLLFNGDNINPYSLHLINPDSLSPTVNSVSLSLTNESRIYINPILYPMGIRAVVSNVGDSGTNPSMVFSSDLERPSFVKLGIFQNAQADRFLDLYVFSKERLFKDVRVETPVVEVTQDTFFQTVPMEIFHEPLPPNDSLIKVIYKGDITLFTSGVTQIVLKGEDAAGNDIVPETTSVSVKHIRSGEGGVVSSIEEGMHVTIPANVLKKDTYITVFTLESSGGNRIVSHPSYGALVSKPDEMTPLDFAYRIGPSGLHFNKPSQLSISLKDDQSSDPSQIGIYRLEGEDWVYAGGILEGGTISTEIKLLGTYQVLLGPHPPNPTLPRVYSLSQNIPNPMGGETIIQYQLPKESDVKLEIYNVLGQKVRILVKGREKAGFKSISWDGSDESGRVVANGVYFYSLKARIGQSVDFKQTKKLILLK
jgi:hypothetical protein